MGAALSSTTRTFVSEPSFPISASRGSVCSGGFERSGIGHRRISLPGVLAAVRAPNSGAMTPVFDQPSIEYVPQV